MSLSMFLQLRFEERDALRESIKQLEKNLTDSLDKIAKRASMPDIADGGDEIKFNTKDIFEEYAQKLFENANITDEIEWNELTSSEFVTSIQTTIGNINTLKVKGYYGLFYLDSL